MPGLGGEYANEQRQQVVRVERRDVEDLSFLLFRRLAQPHSSTGRAVNASEKGCTNCLLCLSSITEAAWQQHVCEYTVHHVSCWPSDAKAHATERRQLYPPGAIQDSVQDILPISLAQVARRENLSPIYSYDAKIRATSFWGRCLERHLSTRTLNTQVTLFSFI